MATKKAPVTKAKKKADSTEETRDAIIAFFMSKGLTPAQAAGIAGNAEAESSYNPQEPGGGLFQDLGGRGAGQGASLEAQLDAAWNELPTEGLAALRKTKTPGEAAKVFEESFERPKKDNTSTREQYANEAYAAVNGKEGAGLNASEIPVVGGTVEAAKNATESVAGFLGKVSKLWEEPQRSAKFVGGSILLFIGLTTLTRDSSFGSSGSNTAPVKHTLEVAAGAAAGGYVGAKKAVKHVRKSSAKSSAKAPAKPAAAKPAKKAPAKPAPSKGRMKLTAGSSSTGGLK